MILNGEIGTFEIEVLCKNNTSSNEFWEANWLHSVVKGSFPGFTFNFNTNLRADDLQRLYKQLNDLVHYKETEAKLLTIEDNINLNFNRIHTGGIKVTGRVTAIDLTGCMLEFKFDSDNPTVERFAIEIKMILEEYPIIGQL